MPGIRTSVRFNNKKKDMVRLDHTVLLYCSSFAVAHDQQILLFVKTGEILCWKLPLFRWWIKQLSKRGLQQGKYFWHGPLWGEVCVLSVLVIGLPRKMTPWFSVTSLLQPRLRQQWLPLLRNKYNVYWPIAKYGALGRCGELQRFPVRVVLWSVVQIGGLETTMDGAAVRLTAYSQRDVLPVLSYSGKWWHHDTRFVL